MAVPGEAGVSAREDHARRAKPRVAIYAQPEYFRFTYEHDLDEIADVLEVRMQMGMQLSEFRQLIEFDADYNFFYRGEFVPPGVLEQLRGVKVALSSEPFPRVVNGRYSYTADSVRRYMVFRTIRSMPYDYVFHYDDASLPFLQWDGLRLSGHFALPVATSTYSPRERRKDWDLFFIGRSTPHRERFFGLPKHRHHFLHICHGLWGQGLVDYLQSAKICLNVHAENEISWEPRMQMMMACGVFVISERITPNVYLRPGIDYVQVDSPAEMHEAVEHYLNASDERDLIARSGYERVIDQLAARKAFGTLIEGIEQGRFPRFQSDQGATSMRALVAADQHWARARRTVRRVIGSVG